MTSKYLHTSVIPPSSPEQNWARSVSPCTPARLLGLSPLSPTPPPPLSPSKLFDEVMLQPQIDLTLPRSPLVKTTRKAPARKPAGGAPSVSEHFAKTTRSGNSKAKTVRTKKSSKGQEAQNKILTGRVAKAATTSKENEIDGLKPNAGKRKTKATTKSEDGKLPGVKKVADSEELNLEEALKRRSDWTPPKVSATITLDDDSLSANGVQKASFGNALRDYHYSRENSVSDMARTDSNPTKRRRLELVDSKLLQERKPLEQKRPQDAEKTRKTKPKPKKLPKTITGRMTALYEPIDVTEELFVFDEESEAGEGFKKPAKPKKKKSTKPREPEYVILSPDAATKSVNDQNFMFGTCSQLERDDSPTFFEETQRALRLSESLVLETNALETVSAVHSSTGIMNKYSGKKSHWSEAARDIHGAVVQPEIIDMTDSPSIDIALGRLSQFDREAPKMPPLASSECRSATECLVDKDIIPARETAADTQAISAKPKPGYNGSEKSQSNVESLNTKHRRPIAEMPNYNGYTDEELKKEVKSYGLKAIRGRKKTIAVLEKCWQSKHGNAATTTDKTETVSLKRINDTASVPANIHTTTQASERLPVRKKQTKSLGEDSATANPAEKKKAVKKSAARKVQAVPAKATSPKRTSTYTPDEIEDSEEEIIPSPTRIRMQRQGSSRPTTPTISCLPLGNKSKRPSTKSKVSSIVDEATLLELQSSITKAIRLQTRPKNKQLLGHSLHPPHLTWHEKILLYEPIILEDFAAWLNTEGLASVYEDREVGVALVRTWCESQGICCTFRA